MPDNTVLPGTGETFASNVITDGGVANGAKVERVKAGFGPAGSYKDPTLDDGFPVELTGAAASAVTAVAASVTTVPLLAANTDRRGASIYNDSASASLYIKLGATASTISFTVKLRPGGLYELPPPVWRGAIDGIWSAAVGSARITELT